MKLYEIPAAIRSIEYRIAEAEGVITPEMEEELERLQETMEEKVEYIALLSREAKAEAAAYRQEEDRLSAARKAAERREASLKQYLDFCLTSANVERVERPTVKVRLQRNSAPSVVVAVDPEALPEEFRRVTVTPDTKALGEIAKTGGALPEGVTASWGHHVRIW